MRIIGGLFKGRSLNFLKNPNTRPLKDSVKENIFNILEHSNLLKSKIKNSNTLDLYAGTGSFGIECISRGAEKVTFVEQDKNALKILKENLIKLSITDKTKTYFNRIENILTYNLSEKYHIFFLDPPFADFEFLKNLKLIKKKKIFKEKHIVIIHREKKINDNFENCLKIIQIKQYGRSKIYFGKFN